MQRLRRRRTQNGAGKTTLIKRVLGLLRAKSGSVGVLGLDPVRHRVPVVWRIGYLSEERDLPDWMRIGEVQAVGPPSLLHSLARRCQPVGHLADGGVSWVDLCTETCSVARK